VAWGGINHKRKSAHRERGSLYYSIFWIGCQPKKNGIFWKKEVDLLD